MLKDVATLLVHTHAFVVLAIDLMMIITLVLVSLKVNIPAQSMAICPFPLAEIHECLEGSHVCDQRCTNTNGSYVCSCNAGYRLNEDGHTCTGKPKKHVKSDCLVEKATLRRVC